MRKLACGTEQQDLVGDRRKPFPGVEVEKAKADVGDNVDEHPDGKSKPPGNLHHNLPHLHLTSEMCSQYSNLTLETYWSATI